MSIEIFEKKYMDAFKELGISLTPEDGVPEDKIGFQERVLEVEFPIALRAYYLIAGNQELNQGSNIIFEIQNIYKWEEYLVFMREGNGMESWGISIDSASEIDPPVHAGLDAGFLNPYLQEESCSDFLTLNVFSQAMTGGFKHHGEGHIKTSVAETIKESWKSVGGGFYTSNVKLLYFPDENFGEEGTVFVSAAARLEKDFIDMIWDLSARLSNMD